MSPVNTNLINALLEAVQGGAVPLPVAGESVDDFRFRAAHAGALVAIKWASDQAIRDAEAAAAQDNEGHPSGATVTSLPVTPLSQNESAGV